MALGRCWPTGISKFTLRLKLYVEIFFFSPPNILVAGDDHKMTILFSRFLYPPTKAFFNAKSKGTLHGEHDERYLEIEALKEKFRWFSEQAVETSFEIGSFEALR